MNEVTNLAASAITQNQHDPWVSGLVFVLAIVILLITIARPIMGLVKNYKSDKAETARAEAETTLFEQLKIQLESNTKAIEELNKEKEKWFRLATELENEVKRLKLFEEMVNSMKGRLDEKDRVIEERDNEIRALNRIILEMKDAIHNLEIRLMRDEQQFCAKCEFRP